MALRRTASNKSYWTSLVGTTITYDKRNNAKTPTRGFYLQLDDDFAGVGGDAQYWRVNAEARGYYPVTEKITLVGRAIGGHIQGWGGDDVRLLDASSKVVRRSAVSIAPVMVRATWFK